MHVYVVLWEYPYEGDVYLGVSKSLQEAKTFAEGRAFHCDATIRWQEKWSGPESSSYLDGIPSSGSGSYTIWRETI